MWWYDKGSFERWKMSLVSLTSVLVCETHTLILGFPFPVYVVIAPGDNLFVVQAYDDGWCLCRSVHNEQGVVPQSCLSPVVATSSFSAEAAKRTSIVPTIQMPLPAVVVSGDGGMDEVLAPMMQRSAATTEEEEEMKTLAPPLSR
jgi:hypothetical protein